MGDWRVPDHMMISDGTSCLACGTKGFRKTAHGTCSFCEEGDMRRKIEFPITARVIVVTASNASLEEIARHYALELEQRVNARGDIRAHVPLEPKDIPTQVMYIRESDGNEADLAAGFVAGDPTSYNPNCPVCHRTNALVPRAFMGSEDKLVCRSCGHAEELR